MINAKPTSLAANTIKDIKQNMQKNMPTSQLLLINNPVS